MLRIAWRDGEENDTVMRLEGRMLGLWVEEVRRSCERLLAEGRVLTLDLGDVSFLDTDGVRLLRALARRRVRLIHCSAFIAELLRSAGSQRKRGRRL